VEEEDADVAEDDRRYEHRHQEVHQRISEREK